MTGNDTVPCLQVDSPANPSTSNAAGHQGLNALQQPNINSPAPFTAGPPAVNHENQLFQCHFQLGSLNQPLVLDSTLPYFLPHQPADYSDGLYFDPSQDVQAPVWAQAGNPLSFPVRLIFLQTLLTNGAWAYCFKPLLSSWDWADQHGMVT